MRWWPCSSASLGRLMIFPSTSCRRGGIFI